jgi:mannose-6-phosphate isomerase-like protein (cupin superfamily)
MSNEGDFEFIRPVDVARLQSSAADERFVQHLLDHASGAVTCSVSVIRTPPGGGSPAGLHVHDVDQLFYVLSGTMSIEVAGRSMSAGPNSLVVFPAGVPHRNWNDGVESTVHIAFNAPLPDPARPFARQPEPEVAGGA